MSCAGWKWTCKQTGDSMTIDDCSCCITTVLTLTDTTTHSATHYVSTTLLVKKNAVSKFISSPRSICHCLPLRKCNRIGGLTSGVFWKKTVFFNRYWSWLRTFAGKFSNTDFFLKILPLKNDELLQEPIMSKMYKNRGSQTSKFVLERTYPEEHLKEQVRI